MSGGRDSDGAGGSISSISSCFPSQPLAVVCVSDANQPVMRMTKAVDAIHVFIHPRNRIIARADRRGEEERTSCRKAKKSRRQA